MGGIARPQRGANIVDQYISNILGAMRVTQKIAAQGRRGNFGHMLMLGNRRNLLGR